MRRIAVPDRVAGITDSSCQREVISILDAITSRHQHRSQRGRGKVAVVEQIVNQRVKLIQNFGGVHATSITLVGFLSESRQADQTNSNSRFPSRSACAFIHWLRLTVITLTSSKPDLFRLARILPLGSVNTTGSCIVEERSETFRGANRKSFGNTVPGALRSARWRLTRRDFPPARPANTSTEARGQRFDALTQPRTTQFTWEADSMLYVACPSCDSAPQGFRRRHKRRGRGFARTLAGWAQRRQSSPRYAQGNR